VLIDEKMVDEATLEEAAREQAASGESLIGVLKRREVLSGEQMTRVVAAANGIEFVELSPDMVDGMTAHLVSYEMVNKHNVIPVRKEEGKLVVAMSSPLNLAVRDQIELKSGYEVVPVAASASAIRQAIRFHFNVRDVTRQTIVSMRFKKEEGDEEDDKLIEGKLVEAERGAAKGAETPITRLVSSILNGAVDARASDIHIEPQGTEMRVRYRVDGLLHDALSVPASAQPEVVSHIKILSEMDISERRVPQDGHLMLMHEGKEYDLRVSSLPAVGGEKIVMRILDKHAEKWSLDHVAANPEDNRKLRELAANPYGMILLTGPTGCGKTTTLYSLLQLLNTPERNIVTVEDPVEYRLEGITQLQVRPVAGVTFASALRSIVRQDPDIILVGEIRDPETAEIAISAALTGHLVLSTLHTNDAAGAVSRLINLGIAPFLAASALLGSVAQRLVRTTCTMCRERYEPRQDVLRMFKGLLGEREKLYYRGTGCNSCRETGYLGRKAVFEILAVSPRIRRMIVEGVSDGQIKEQAVCEVMRTLNQSAIEEATSGVTTLEEIMRVVDVGEQ
jgi:type IV pilus assembly protein PilB